MALAAAGDTREVYRDHIINTVSGGRRSAQLLDLVFAHPDGQSLTHLGAEVVRYAQNRHGSIAAALDKFASWKSRSTRFTELDSGWAQLARSVAIQYEPIELIVEALERLHRRGSTQPTIDVLANEAAQINRPLTVEVFFTQTRRSDVLTSDGEIDGSELTDPTVYKSGIHFQFKYHLYHIGLLTEGGTDDKDAVLTDPWLLEHPVNASDFST